MSSLKSIMEFEKTMEYMEPLQVTEHLRRILEFLKRNDTELSFPNISPYVEVFLVSLVTDTRNLKCKLFNNENKRYASEIIEVLEMTRDVFRWTHSYENGKQGKSLLVYKKIYTNKIKKKNTRTSSISHRLMQAQASNTQTSSQTNNQLSQNDLPTLSVDFKLAFLNKTLRFIKDDTETAFYYSEMPLPQAEYIHSLLKNPSSGNDIGFGYKSMYAPLWDAMEKMCARFQLQMTLQPTKNHDTAVLKLEKIPKNSNNKSNNDTEKSATNNDLNKNKNEIVLQKMLTKSKESSNKEKIIQSLNSSTASSAPSSLPTTIAPPKSKFSDVSEKFIRETIFALTEFASDPTRASISFDRLTNDEMIFVKHVKGLAASTKERDKLKSQFRDMLVRLHASVTQALKTCKITTTINEKNRGITLKKTPIFTAPAPVTQKSPITAGARSKSLAASATKLRERSLSNDRLIQFQSASKLPPPNDEGSSTDKLEQERGRSRERKGMNKRTAKLLEDMSTPVESDKGIRMMLLMGWDGGALGARGEGLVEPIIPAIELPAGAGLGHVPPAPAPQRRPEHFRTTLMTGMLELLTHHDSQKTLQYKEPLSKKERKFVPAALKCLNARRPTGLWSEEAELAGFLLRELEKHPGLDLRADLSQDLRTVTLVKIKKDVSQPAAKQVKVKNPNKKTVVKEQSMVISISDEDADVLITDYDIAAAIPYAHTTFSQPPKNLKLIKRRASRMVFVQKITEVLHWQSQDIWFKSTSFISNGLIAFLEKSISALYSDPRVHMNSLLGLERWLYEDLRVFGQPWLLSLEFKDRTVFVLKKKSLFYKERQIEGRTKVINNNNNMRIINQNQVTPKNDVTKPTVVDKDGLKEHHVVQNDVDKHKSPKTINEHRSQNDTIVITNTNMDKDEKCNIVNKICTESDTPKEKNDINVEINVDNLKRNVIVENLDSKVTNVDIVNNKCTTNDTSKENNDMYIEINVKNINILKKIDVDMEAIDNSNENMEERLAVIKTECDSEILNDKNGDTIVDIKKEIEECDDVETGLIPETIDLSDWDKDIQDLEMAIFDSELDIKKENGINNHPNELDMSISQADLDLNEIKNENIDDSPGSKRSRVDLNNSQELDPKRTKINELSSEENEVIVIISAKNANEKITHDVIANIQSLISDEIDRDSGFLPLLKCHGALKPGLVYSCHDNEDVEWLKKVLSTSNLDLNVVADDSCLEKKSRKMIIKINSFIPLDTVKTFSRLVTYNVGLDTRSWKVLSKHTDSTFSVFIVEVDEKSFKYISDENFSLYCGIDKAHFSIIF